MMQKSSKFSKIAGLIRTRDDRDLTMMEIDLLRNSLYQDEEEAFETVLNDSVRRSMALAMRESLQESKMEKVDFLKAVKERLAVMKPVRMTLAHEPSEAMVDRMADWAHQRTGLEVYLDLVYDPAIIGGAVIVYQGKYGDFTVRSRLDEIFAETNELGENS